MKSISYIPLAWLAASVTSATAAMPAMMAPSGYQWSLVNTATYSTGTVYTETGGFNGQTSGPYNDTSYGVMDEPSTPWYTGNDQSDQQFIQQQVTNNFGTSSPPGPSGYRFWNSGTPGVTTVNQTSGATSASSNFPSNAKEIRTVTLTNWNNPNKDNAMATGSPGQFVYKPTSGTINTSRGYGADEMYMAVDGGGSGTSQFGVSFNIYSMMTSTQYGISEGTLATNRDYINGSMTVEVNNAGGGNYGFDGSNRIAYGLGINTSDPSLNQSNIVSGGSVSGTNYEDSASTGSMVQGIPANSVGDSIDQAFSIAAGSVDESGSTFDITFESDAEMWAWKNWGNADARFSMGPGMAGNAGMTVDYEVWQLVLIPEPSSALLGLLGGLGLCLRRKR